MLQQIHIYKPLGYTPYQMVQLFKKKFPEYAHEKIGYAGRLDPMAEGVLLLLIGETNKNKKEFENLEKEYVFEAILGVETDTYDLLGKVLLYSNKQTTISIGDLQNEISSFTGNITQTYPPFSSVRVNGKPLFYWAFHNKLDTLEIPSKKVNVFEITLNKLHKIKAEELKSVVQKRVHSVKGNFRQAEILTTWRQFFLKNTVNEFPLFTATVKCSSGTYVRSLVHELGQKLHTHATTFSIKRSSVGQYTLDTSLRLITENKG